MAKTFTILVCVFALFPASVYAATLTITAPKKTITVGERLIVQVQVSSETPFNAASGSITFPKQLTVEGVSKAQSVLNFWVVDPAVSGNTVTFEGVALGGFRGGGGTLVTITARAVQEGSGNISFNSGKVLANDGKGTDISSELSGLTVTVIPAAAIPSVTPPRSINAPSAVVETVAPEQTHSLQAPHVVLAQKYGSVAIAGTSQHPYAQVMLTFSSDDGSEVFVHGITDARGDFLITVPSVFRWGTYLVQAVLFQDGTYSEASNNIRVVIGGPFRYLDMEILIPLISALVALLSFLSCVALYFKKENTRQTYSAKR